MEEIEFNTHVSSLRDRMFRFAWSLLGQRDEAEDVTHDTLVRLWTQRERLDDCRNVEAFVMTSLRNRCYDRLRRLNFFERDTTLVPAVDADMERCEACEIVATAMAFLPEKQREVLHLKDIEGYATHEIAEMLAVGENQVRVILSRARKGLREAIERIDYGTDNRKN